MFITPILAAQAVSLGSELVQALTNKTSTRAAEQANAAKTSAAFNELLTQAQDAPQLQHAKVLKSHRIHDLGDAELRLNQIAGQLLQDPALHDTISGGGASFELRFLPEGKVAVRSATGAERIISLSGETKELAADAHSIIQAVQAAQTHPGTLRGSNASKPVTGSLVVVPGGKVTLR